MRSPGDRAVAVASSFQISNHGGAEGLGITLGPEPRTIVGDIDGFEANAYLTEDARESLPGGLDVVQATAISQDHAAMAEGLQNIRDASAHGHGVAVEIETRGAHHAALGGHNHQGAPDRSGP